jgi:hypothetical protein
MILFLQSSFFKDIFNYETYKVWSKNQILEPINDIISLSNTSVLRLEDSIKNLENQIKNTDKSLS